MNHYKSTLTLTITVVLTLTCYFIYGTAEAQDNATKAKESIFDMPQKQAELNQLTRMMNYAIPLLCLNACFGALFAQTFNRVDIQQKTLNNG